MHDVQARVSGVSGGSQCAKKSWAEAVDVYKAAYEAGTIHVEPKAGGPFDRPAGSQGVESEGEGATEAEVMEDWAETWDEDVEALFQRLRL